MPVLGEAALDTDGVLHGWCWNPANPSERRAIEILFDGEIAVSLVASRFREDLRFRNFGDGYHGFSVTLTRHIATASPRSILSARDRTTGYVFWQKTFGEFSISENLDARLDTLRAEIGAGAHSPSLVRPARKAVDAFGELGELLKARAGKRAQQPPPRPFTLPWLQAPALSVILDASLDAADLIHKLRIAAPTLHQAGAEVILTNGEADPQMALLQSQAKNVRYIFVPGPSSAARRNLGAAVARGTALVFLSSGLTGLSETARQAAERIVVSGLIADAAHRIAPSLAAGIAAIPSCAPPGFTLALPRACFETHGGFDATMDDGAGLNILDFVLRAASNGAEIAAWRCPDVPGPAPASPDIIAGRRFAERWITGASSPAFA